MIEFLMYNYDRVLEYLLDHLILVATTLFFSIVFATLISIFSLKYSKIGGAINKVMLLLYCVPSIAMFCFLIPFFGLGKVTAIVSMTIYNQILLLRNFKLANVSIPLSVKEAAEGIGLKKSYVFIHIKLPLMMPYILSGIRIATISTIGIASMAALIDGGGLGVLLFEGLRTNHPSKLICAIILISILAFLINTVFSAIEKKATEYASGKRKK